MWCDELVECPRQDDARQRSELKVMSSSHPGQRSRSADLTHYEAPYDDTSTFRCSRRDYINSSSIASDYRQISRRWYDIAVARATVAGGNQPQQQQRPVIGRQSTAADQLDGRHRRGNDVSESRMTSSESRLNRGGELLLPDSPGVDGGGGTWNEGETGRSRQATAGRVESTLTRRRCRSVSRTRRRALSTEMRLVRTTTTTEITTITSPPTCDDAQRCLATAVAVDTSRFYGYDAVATDNSVDWASSWAEHAHVSLPCPVEVCDVTGGRSDVTVTSYRCAEVKSAGGDVTTSGDLDLDLEGRQRGSATEDRLRDDVVDQSLSTTCTAEDAELYKVTDSRHLDKDTGDLENGICLPVDESPIDHVDKIAPLPTPVVTVLDTDEDSWVTADDVDPDDEDQRDESSTVDEDDTVCELQDTSDQHLDAPVNRVTSADDEHSSEEDVDEVADVVQVESDASSSSTLQSVYSGDDMVGREDSLGVVDHRELDGQEMKFSTAVLSPPHSDDILASDGRQVPPVVVKRPETTTTAAETTTSTVAATTTTTRATTKTTAAGTTTTTSVPVTTTTVADTRQAETTTIPAKPQVGRQRDDVTVDDVTASCSGARVAVLADDYAVDVESRGTTAAFTTSMTRGNMATAGDVIRLPVGLRHVTGHVMLERRQTEETNEIREVIWKRRYVSQPVNTPASSLVDDVPLLPGVSDDDVFMTSDSTSHGGQVVCLQLYNDWQLSLTNHFGPSEPPEHAEFYVDHRHRSVDDERQIYLAALSSSCDDVGFEVPDTVAVLDASDSVDLTAAVACFEDRQSPAVCDVTKRHYDVTMTSDRCSDASTTKSAGIDVTTSGDLDLDLEGHQRGSATDDRRCDVTSTIVNDHSLSTTCTAEDTELHELTDSRHLDEDTGDLENGSRLPVDDHADKTLVVAVLDTDENSWLTADDVDPDNEDQRESSTTDDDTATSDQQLQAPVNHVTSADEHSSEEDEDEVSEVVQVESDASSSSTLQSVYSDDDVVGRENSLDVVDHRELDGVEMDWPSTALCPSHSDDILASDVRQLQPVVVKRPETTTTAAETTTTWVAATTTTPGVTAKTTAAETTTTTILVTTTTVVDTTTTTAAETVTIPAKQEVGRQRDDVTVDDVIASCSDSAGWRVADDNVDVESRRATTASTSIKRCNMATGDDVLLLPVGARHVTGHVVSERRQTDEMSELREVIENGRAVHDSLLPGVDDVFMTSDSTSRDGQPVCLQLYNDWQLSLTSHFGPSELPDQAEFYVDHRNASVDVERQICLSSSCGVLVVKVPDMTAVLDARDSVDLTAAVACLEDWQSPVVCAVTERRDDVTMTSDRCADATTTKSAGGEVMTSSDLDLDLDFEGRQRGSATDDRLLDDVVDQSLSTTCTAEDIELQEQMDSRHLDEDTCDLENGSRLPVDHHADKTVGHQVPTPVVTVLDTDEDSWVTADDVDPDDEDQRDESSTTDDDDTVCERPATSDQQLEAPVNHVTSADDEHSSEEDVDEVPDVVQVEVDSDDVGSVIYHVDKHRLTAGCQSVTEDDCQPVCLHLYDDLQLSLANHFGPNDTSDQAEFYVDHGRANVDDPLERPLSCDVEVPAEFNGMFSAVDTEERLTSVHSETANYANYEQSVTVSTVPLVSDDSGAVVKPSASDVTGEVESLTEDWCAKRSVSSECRGSRQGEVDREEGGLVIHHYGEMWSIFREIPLWVEVLRAEVVERHNSDPRISRLLLRYPSLRPGTWKWTTAPLVRDMRRTAKQDLEDDGFQPRSTTDPPHLVVTDYWSYAVQPTIERCELVVTSSRDVIE